MKQTPKRPVLERRFDRMRANSSRSTFEPGCVFHLPAHWSKCRERQFPYAAFIAHRITTCRWPLDGSPANCPVERFVAVTNPVTTHRKCDVRLLRLCRSAVQLCCISSVITSKRESVAGPNAVDRATSVASRPVAIRIRPMRGVLCRASTVCQ